MLISFLHNFSLIICFIFILTALKKYVFKHDISRQLYKLITVSSCSLLSLLLMIDPYIYRYSQARFDFRSLPLFAISYIGGWQAGAAAALLPAAYRIYLGGTTVFEGIIFDIALAVVIGALFGNNHSRSLLIRINKRRIATAFLIFALINFLVPGIWHGWTPLLWQVFFIFSFLSLAAVIIAVYIINETNKGIMDYRYVQEDLRESRVKLQHQKLMTEYFGNLSHELKTPLNLILSAQQLLTKKLEFLPGCKTVDRYIVTIKQNSLRLLRLVNNIIDTMRMDLDHYQLQLKDCDIVRVVEGIVASVEDYAAASGKILSLSSQSSSKIAAVDPDALERVLLNLLSNAVKFTEEGDKIAVKVSSGEEKIFISVKDTGIGIKEDKQEMIFDLFKQAEDPLIKSREGSGVGLYLTRLLVELHGGRIILKSRWGEGSEFIIEIPDRVIGGDGEGSLEKAGEMVDRVHIEFADINDTF